MRREPHSSAPADHALRVAVACSGLGHIQRGIESWAVDLARALERAGVNTALFGGHAGPGIIGLPCLRRTGPAARGIAGACRHFGGWRYGCGSPYEIEQTSFALALCSRIWRGAFDILHVQDPAVATWFEIAHRRGLTRTKVIYANGTGEDAPVMRRFRYLQFLTPQGYQDWQPARPRAQSTFMVPNFVDTDRFGPGDQQRARAAFSLPPDSLVVLCCAAIRRHHKRIDYLVAEFERALHLTNRDMILVIAGGREADTDRIIAEGRALLGDRVRFLTDVPRDRMPDLYRTADVFTLASMHEMFGIVLIEAMASGLPVVCHDAPGFRSIVGPAGHYADLSVPGGLATALTEALDPQVRHRLSRTARPQAEGTFGEKVVVRDILAMYRQVLSEPAR